MALGESVSLYAGDDLPRIKLQCTHKFLTVEELCKFLTNIQDIYYIDFQTCETITENLKIYANGNDKTLPFYLLEYDEINDCFFLWKSNGSWKMDNIIAQFYQNNIAKDGYTNDLLHWFVEDTRFQTHSNKAQLKEFVKDLKFDWDLETVNQFWESFQVLLKEKGDLSNDPFVFKSLVILSILKVKVLQSRIQLKDALDNYYMKLSKTKLPVLSSPTSIRSELEEQVRSPLTTNSSTDDENYVYDKTSADKNKVTKKYRKENTQLVHNFDHHFKIIAEDYENFELKNKRKSNKKQTSMDK